MNMDLFDKEYAHLVGLPFIFYARYMPEFTEKDLNYLINTIKKHACFELIYSTRNIRNIRTRNIRNIRNGKYSPIEVCYAKINQIVFYSKFYNDPKCPPGIKLSLFYYLGFLRAYVEKSYPNLLELRYEYVEKWIDRLFHNR